MTYPKITFIGGGNMATAMLSGLLNNSYPRENFVVIEPDAKRRKDLTQRFAITCLAHADSSSIAADFVILAVKPQIIRGVCEDLAKHSSNAQSVFISIAAGTTTQHLMEWLKLLNNTDPVVVRAMPNTPALIGESATGLYSAKQLSNDKQAAIEAIFASIGQAIWLDQEELIDSVTALSGSGPAYFFGFMEALCNAGIQQGLTPDQAQKLVLQTALGAALMAKQYVTGENVNALQELRERVTSKGGTTAAGMASLQTHKFSEIVAQAVQAAKQRATELAKARD